MAKTIKSVNKKSCHSSSSLNLGSLQLSSILYLYFCTFHISLTDQSLPRAHWGPSWPPHMRSSGCRASWQGYRLICLQVSPRVQREFAKGRLVMLFELEVKKPTLPSAPSLLGSPRPSCWLLALAPSGNASPVQLQFREIPTVMPTVHDFAIDIDCIINKSNRL